MLICNKAYTLPGGNVGSFTVESNFQDKSLSQLAKDISRDLNYSNVYHHSNLYPKGDAVQQEPVGDRISITMAGQIPGCIRSRSFDGDGMLLNNQEVVKDGIAVGYYGPSRFGQYLGETPTGNLPCMDVALGTAGNADLSGSWLQVISMSGLQVDLHNDYIGGEVRLAYYHQGDKMVPMTGISIAGKVSQVLKSIRLWDSPAVYGGYRGPARAILQDMQIF